MSEYQYYEFRAVDRPLKEKEMSELRALSSRAEITATSLTNEYNYGDFRGNSDALMEKYFDAFVYVANWGTHRFVIRVPRGLLDEKVVDSFHLDEMLAVRKTKTHLIIDFRSEEEGGRWENGEGWMDNLLAVRQEIMAGDLRALYLGWLCGVQIGSGIIYDEDGQREGSFNEDWEAEAQEGDAEDTLCNKEREPPLPPGLTKLSPAQSKLAEYLRLDPDLIAAAAHGSGATPVTEPTPQERAAWIASLPEKDKTDLLVRLAEGETTAVQAEVLRRFQEQWNRHRHPMSRADQRRTVGKLRQAYREYVARQHKKAQAIAIRDKAQRDATAAVKRTERLDALEQREETAWNQAEELIASKLPKNYDEAVKLLRDLYDLAERRYRSERALSRLKELRQRHCAKRTFLQRLEKAGVP